MNDIEDLTVEGAEGPNGADENVGVHGASQNVGGSESGRKWQFG